MRIAVTGTVGSGKSGVAAQLAAALRCDAVDTDQLCRNALGSGQPAWCELRARYPERFFAEDGSLDRVQLRQAVFADAALRLELEGILHPIVRDQVAAHARAALITRRHLLVEVPLLFEVGWQHDFEQVVAVYAPQEVCIERTVARDNASREQAASIVALQLSPEEKAAKADWVIDNGGIWAATVLQVSYLVRQLQSSCLPCEQ